MELLAKWSDFNRNLSNRWAKEKAEREAKRERREAELIEAQTQGRLISDRDMTLLSQFKDDAYRGIVAPVAGSVGDVVDLLNMGGKDVGGYSVQDLYPEGQEMAQPGNPLATTEDFIRYGDDAGLTSTERRPWAEILAGVGTGSALGLMDSVGGSANKLQRMYGKQQGVIGGHKALNADLKALEKAKNMKANGANADDIYKDTQWWLDHPDGKPRFEIDDSKASLTGATQMMQSADDTYIPPYNGDIHGYIDHKNLFDNYDISADVKEIADNG